MLLPGMASLRVMRPCLHIALLSEGAADIISIGANLHHTCHTRSQFLHNFVPYWEQKEEGWQEYGQAPPQCGERN